MAEIRLAAERDIPGLVRLSEMYRNEMPDTRPRINEPRLVEYLNLCFSSPLLHLSVADSEGLVGLIHGGLGGMYFDEPEAYVDMIYVENGYRDWRTFRRLWLAFENWSRDKGASHLSASEIKEKSLAPLMRRIGMQERGLYYRKAL